ncbi:MAG: hypothetical protein WB799_18290 [Candidatus Sulfotelmatobacter sp.]
MRKRIPTFFRGDAEIAGQSLDSEVRRKALYRQCELEAKQETEAAKAAAQKKIDDGDGTTAKREAEARTNDKVRRVWAKSSDILIEHSGLRTAWDPYNDLPHIEGDPVEISEEEAFTAGKSFIAWLEAEKGITLSPDSQTKIFLYAGLHGEGDDTLDPRARNFWERIFTRLNELGVLEVVGAEPKKAKAAPEPLSYDAQVKAERNEAEKEYAQQVGGLFSQWLASVAQNFDGFELSEDQKAAAVDMLERRRLNLYDKASYDTVRIALVLNRILPEHLLTRDEFVAHVLIPRYDFNDPVQRRNFIVAKNAVLFDTKAV